MNKFVFILANFCFYYSCPLLLEIFLHSICFLEVSNYSYSAILRQIQQMGLFLHLNEPFKYKAQTVNNRLLKAGTHLHVLFQMWLQVSNSIILNISWRCLPFSSLLMLPPLSDSGRIKSLRNEGWPEVLSAALNQDILIIIYFHIWKTAWKHFQMLIYSPCIVRNQVKHWTRINDHQQCTDECP